MKTELKGCKFHDYAHPYTKHTCGCEYCPFYWLACPRCHGSDDSNMVASARTFSETEITALRLMKKSGSV
jgi:hypothetical protein